MILNKTSHLLRLSLAPYSEESLPKTAFISFHPFLVCIIVQIFKPNPCSLAGEVSDSENTGPSPASPEHITSKRSRRQKSAASPPPPRRGNLRWQAQGEDDGEEEGMVVDVSDDDVDDDVLCE